MAKSLLKQDLLSRLHYDVIVTVVALVNVFPLIVTGVVPQVLPLKLPSVRVGPFAHPHDTEKLLPVVVHPEEFLTVIVWLPFAIPANVTPDWYEPPSKLYSIPAPVGPVTVIAAFPDPRLQSIVCEGLAGLVFTVAITAVLAAVVHPLAVAST